MNQPTTGGVAVVVLLRYGGRFGTKGPGAIVETMIAFPSVGLVIRQKEPN